jgi:hypothetical protein
MVTPDPDYTNSLQEVTEMKGSYVLHRYFLTVFVYGQVVHHYLQTASRTMQSRLRKRGRMGKWSYIHTIRKQVRKRGRRGSGPTSTPSGSRSGRGAGWASGPTSTPPGSRSGRGAEWESWPSQIIWVTYLDFHLDFGLFLMQIIGYLHAGLISEKTNIRNS